MHGKAKFVCFNYMQPRKVKFKSVQINMKQVSYSNPTVHPSVPPCNQCISPIFFEVGIPNLVCGCILVW